MYNFTGLKKLLLSAIAILTVSVSNGQVVTNTSDAGPGSLRQAILDVNAGSLSTEIRFNIPLSDPNYNSATGVFTIKINSQLPAISRNNVVVNGASQTNNTGNTNTTLLGTGGKVGVDSLVLNKVDGPEIEIVDNGNVSRGLQISANQVIIRRIAIYGFGATPYEDHANIVFTNVVTGGVVENCVIGTPADDFVDQGNANRSEACGIAGLGADSIIIRNNVIGFIGARGIYARNDAGKNCEGWNISGNEVTECGFNNTKYDGIDIVINSSGFNINGNYVHHNRICGIDTWQSWGSFVITNNTVTNNGVANDETPGIRVFGSDNLIEKNVIANNFGAGILVHSNASTTRMLSNSIYQNGTIIGENNQSSTGQIGIDLINANENMDQGSLPFVTLNDSADYDDGANNLINFPVLEFAYVNGSNLTITGFLKAGSLLQIFESDDQTQPTYGEGKRLVYSGIPTFSGTGKYGPASVNGLDQGTETTDRFSVTIPTPSGVAAGSYLTSTATRNNHTSEFSGSVQVGSQLGVSPVLECVMRNADGSYTAYYGYNNPNPFPVTIPAGTNNRINPSPTDRGQPTTFAPGRIASVFTVNFTSGNIVWILNGRTSTAGVNSSPCRCMLGVSKSANNPTPRYNDTVTFTIKVYNNGHTNTYGVQLLDSTNTDSLQFIDYTASRGNYNGSTGVWDLGSGNFNIWDTAILTIRMKVRGLAENCITLFATALPDKTPLDNTACASICPSGTSGGNDGGVESNGNLAGIMARRKYTRTLQELNSSNGVKPEQKALMSYTHEAVSQGLIVASTKNLNKKAGELEGLLPETGPFNTPAFVTTPTDLIEATNALEAFAVDYIRPGDNARLGAILAIATPNNQVYEHSKPICDRLAGAALEDVRIVLINNRPFIMSKILQPNNQLDYTVSFVAYRDANLFTIDQKWVIEGYKPAGSLETYNFQVWSASENTTIALTESLLNNLANQKAVFYSNINEPAYPKVFARTLTYGNGKINMQIKNSVNAEELLSFGTVSPFEDGPRTPIQKIYAIAKPITNNKVVDVSLEVGNIFDVGFSIFNDKYPAADQLYIADGPWSFTKDKNTTVSEFLISPFSGVNEPQTYSVERDAKAKGTIDEFFNMFRYLRPQGTPVNLSTYNQLQFNMAGSGQVDVFLTQQGVNSITEQFRVRINLNSTSQLYKLFFNQFKKADGTGMLNPSNITSITFRPVATGSFEMDVKNVSFVNTSTGLNDYNNNEVFSLGQNYPNPATGYTQIDITLNKSNDLLVQVYDLFGNHVTTLANGNYAQGKHVLNMNTKGLASGVYFYTVTCGGTTVTKRMLVLN